MIALSIVSVLVGVDESKYIFDLKDLMPSSGAAGSFFGRPLRLPKANLLINENELQGHQRARANQSSIFFSYKKFRSLLTLTHNTDQLDIMRLFRMH